MIKNLVAKLALILAILFLVLIPMPADAVRQPIENISVHSNSFDLVKYSGNPVLSTDLMPYDERGVRQADILNVFNADYSISYKDNGKYYLFYDSCGGVGVDLWANSMATSTDLINWTKHGITNVLPNPNNWWESIATCAVTVIKYDGIYYMYYMGAPSATPSPANVPSFPNRMGLATTTTIDDTQSWARYSNNPVLDIGSPGTWDSTFVLTGSIVRDPTSPRWMMFYAGYSSSTDIELWGIAYSTDLINWTKYSGNPIGTILLRGEDCPKVFKSDDGYYYMTGNHYPGAYTDRVDLYRNTSPDLTSWEYVGELINKSATGWDSGNIGVGAPIYEDGVLSILYDGGPANTHMNRQIGLAQTQLPPEPPPSQTKLLGQNDTSSQVSNAANFIIMTKYSAISNGTITELRCRVASNVAGNINMGIYVDNNGSPTALLGQKTITVISGAEREVVGVLDSPISISGGTNYWIVFVSNAELVRAKSGTGYIRKYKPFLYGNLPNPAGSGYLDQLNVCYDITSGWGEDVAPPIPPDCPECPTDATLLIKVFVNSIEKASWTQTVEVGETVDLTYTITNIGQ